MMKRAFDLITATLGLVLLMPLFLLLALAVAVASGRPIFFCQKRVGRFGRDFTVFKFRTMTVVPAAEEGSFDLGDGRRVTGVGILLRRTKLDELPQFWNVLLGDMSFVGPRPEIRKWVETYPTRWAVVHKIRPGITDAASIEFRDEEEMLARAEDPERVYRETILPRKLDIYTEYVRRQSFCSDIAIVWKTVVALFRGTHHWS